MRLILKLGICIACINLFMACSKLPFPHPGHSDDKLLFVAVNGNDNNTGAKNRPLATLSKAVEKAEAGFTIIVQGGTYYPAGTIKIQKSGTEANPIIIVGEPNKAPVFDFSHVTSVEDGGFQIEGGWLYLRNFKVTKCPTKGIYVVGEAASNNIFEQLSISETNAAGMVFHIGASNNLILNCDSYRNYDSVRHGQNADGFVFAYGVGLNNKIKNCRAWNNSDDGYDCWEAGNAVTFENCYTWENGFDFWSDPLFEGNGMGFKLGQGTGAHVLRNCAAWNMRRSGFDLNGNTSGVNIDNCTAWTCGKFNFDIFHGLPDGGPETFVTNVLRNNLGFNGENRIRPGVTEQSNSWNIPLTITPDDFISLDVATIQGPRSADGSIPASKFLYLKPSSPAVDAGIDIGLPYKGAAPDLGAFE
jgi:hypothetical protein